MDYVLAALLYSVSAEPKPQRMSSLLCSKQQPVNIGRTGDSLDHVSTLSLRIYEEQRLPATPE